MRKFEEYDLYVKNKDFLISDSVITFTDTNGKLMALKPDVTLSIIKNTKDTSGVQKLYYNENVYRVSNRTRAFKEIMQVGPECIGDVDEENILEVLTIAAKSLSCVSESSVLDISHMGIVSELLDKSGASFECRQQAFRCIGEKNVHELAAVCRSDGVSGEYIELLKKLTLTRGKPAQVLGDIESALCSVVSDSVLKDFERLTTALENSDCGDMICIDFSVVNDMNYYSGIVFKGFVSEIPSSILSGGQYDKLMRKMGRSASAMEKGLTCFWSRSRQELWLKGETSGNYQHIVSITADCDKDALVVVVEPDGPACHMGTFSCFENPVWQSDERSEFSLDMLMEELKGRKEEKKEGSYTSYLFEKGIDKILKKVGEECTEVIIAGKADDKRETVYEIADLTYHVMVLMLEMGISLEDIREELSSRHVIDHKVKQEKMT